MGACIPKLVVPVEKLENNHGDSDIQFISKHLPSGFWV